MKTIFKKFQNVVVWKLKVDSERWKAFVAAWSMASLPSTYRRFLHGLKFTENGTSSVKIDKGQILSDLSMKKRLCVADNESDTGFWCSNSQNFSFKNWCWIHDRWSTISWEAYFCFTRLNFLICAEKLIRVFWNFINKLFKTFDH